MSSQVKQPKGPLFKPPREFKRRGVNGFPIGPRTIRRQKENRELGKLNIRHCEIRIPGICAGRSMLTWAHSKKSRFLVNSTDWQQAARACIPCHDTIEAKSHREMRQIILTAIRSRKSNRKPSCL